MNYYLEFKTYIIVNIISQKLCLSLCTIIYYSHRHQPPEMIMPLYP